MVSNFGQYNFHHVLFTPAARLILSIIRTNALPIYPSLYHIRMSIIILSGVGILIVGPRTCSAGKYFKLRNKMDQYRCILFIASPTPLNTHSSNLVHVQEKMGTWVMASNNS